MQLLARTAFFSFIVLMNFTTSGQAQEGNAITGEKLFKRCSICHNDQADESRRGPSLTGVVGRKAATRPEYPYSDAMRAAGAAGLVWNENELKAFIKKPQAMVKGTWMVFAGMTKERDLNDLIAYLKQHSD